MIARLLRFTSCATLALGLTLNLSAQEAPAPEAEPLPTYYIREYQVEGSKLLSDLEIGQAVYPYLGPGRTEEDVKQAAATLQAAYVAKGFQTASVQLPEQRVVNGVIRLKVVEASVSRLRVKGAKYYQPSRIRRRAPSLAPGTIPNWADVQRDIVNLNRTGDLRVTPAPLTAGLEPGTVDVVLEVEDKLPLHGSIELNNRYTPDTTELRVNGSISYANLWQSGHTIGGSFQVAPQRPDDALVYSGYYLFPLPGSDTVSLFASYTRQDSDISTLGTGVIGKGEIASLRAIFTLPPREGFLHSLTVGFDYKDFIEDVQSFNSTSGSIEISTTPITYYPLSALYAATWLGKKYETEFSMGVNWAFRGLGGADVAEFDYKRYKATGSFFYVRGELSHLHKLPADLHIYGKVQGQLSGEPLINNEQYSGGGLSNARGYLESSALGDNGVFGTVELRSPSLFGAGDDKPNEWRFYVFGDFGVLTLNEALPEQIDRYEFASVGVGSFLRLYDHLNASADVGVPLTDVGDSSSGDPLVTFRLWAEF